jgi:hypothetical protein
MPVLKKVFRFIFEVPASWFFWVGTFVNGLRGADGVRVVRTETGPVVRLGDDQYTWREITSAEPQYTDGVLTGIAFRRLRVFGAAIEETLTVDVEPCDAE